MNNLLSISLFWPELLLTATILIAIVVDIFSQSPKSNKVSNYVIIGTRAISTPHFVSDVCLEFPGHIIVGLDAKNGKLATDGWSKLSNHDANDMAKHFEQDGVAAIIFTDISRDGMLNSLNLKATEDLAKDICIPVIASGGVTDLDDIRLLCKTSEEGILGVITGRAIYEGTLDFVQAQKLADEINKKT